MIGTLMAAPFDADCEPIVTVAVAACARPAKPSPIITTNAPPTNPINFFIFYYLLVIVSQRIYPRTPYHAAVTSPILIPTKFWVVVSFVRFVSGMVVETDW